jgi:RNA polymerase sigma-70 factor (ECF subfamily)
MSIQVALRSANREQAIRSAGNVNLGPVAAVTDDELMRRCAVHDSAALEELARRYQGPIFRFLYRLMGSEGDAEEGALDVFVRVWKSAARFEYRAKVATYLYRIANNVARDAYDRRRVRPVEVPIEAVDGSHLRAASAEEEVLRTVGRQEEARAIRIALEKLSDGDRLILVLYYLEDRSYEDIQAIAGVSRCVLKTRLVRARKRLRLALELDA